MEPENYRGLKWSLKVVSKYTDDGIIYVPPWDTELKKIHDLIIPVFELRGTDEGKVFVGNNFPDPEELHSEYYKSWKKAKVIKSAIAENLLLDRKLPGLLGILTWEILMDPYLQPKKPAIKPTLLQRDTLLVGIANRVTAATDYPLGLSRDNLKARPLLPSGATIAAAAMFSYGVIINPAQAVKICYDHRRLDKDHLSQDAIFAHAGTFKYVPPQYVRRSSNMAYGPVAGLLLEHWAKALVYFG